MCRPDARRSQCPSSADHSRSSLHRLRQFLKRQPLQYSRRQSRRSQRPSRLPHQHRLLHHRHSPRLLHPTRSPSAQSTCPSSQSTCVFPSVSRHQPSFSSSASPSQPRPSSSRARRPRRPSSRGRRQLIRQFISPFLRVTSPSRSFPRRHRRRARPKVRRPALQRGDITRARRRRGRQPRFRASARRSWVRGRHAACLWCEKRDGVRGSKRGEIGRARHTCVTRPAVSRQSDAL